MFDYVPIHTVQDLTRSDPEIDQHGQISQPVPNSFSAVYACPYTSNVYIVLDDCSVQILNTNVWRRFKKPCRRLEITKFAVFYIDNENFVMILNKQNLCNLDLPRIQNCGTLATYDNFFAVSSVSQPKISVFAQTSRNKIEKVTDFRCEDFPWCLAISRDYCVAAIKESYFYRDRRYLIDAFIPETETLSHELRSD